MIGFYSKKEVRKETGGRYIRTLADENLKGHILEGIIYLDLKHRKEIDSVELYRKMFVNAEKRKKI